MATIESLLHRLINVSQFRDNRFRGAGMRVDDRNQAHLSTELALMVREVNTDHGGTSALPWGLYFLEGDLADLQDPPDEVKDTPFIEVIPCDRADPRALQLYWNEGGTKVRLTFTAVARQLRISPPEGASVWIDAYPAFNRDGEPVIVMPVGDKVQVERTRAAAESGS